ncbi:hypothetical protein T484DRAFT_1924716, partial [Baffinella frigidus]
ILHVLGVLRKPNFRPGSRPAPQILACPSATFILSANFYQIASTKSLAFYKNWTHCLSSNKSRRTQE